MIENLNFYNDLKNSFYSELISARQGQKTSLLYAKNQLPASPLVKDQSPFQVMVIGGTNFISATVLRQNGILQILKTTKQKTPILDCTETLLGLIIKHLEPETKILALNFAFRMNPVNRENVLDGELLSGSKGHLLADLLGKTVGFEVETRIFEKLGRKITVAVCNDTVSIGLASLDFLEKTDKNNQKIAVAMVGTGFNSGFFDTSNTFINLESTSFNNFKHSKTLDILDINTSNPGQNLFGKEFSGKYLPQHFNLLSAQNGLNTTIEGSEQLSELAKNDKSKSGEIARGLIQKGAFMMAAHIAALADFMLESDPKKKLNLFIEGSVFCKAYNFEKQTEIALKELSNKQIEIMKIENSSILGTAKLVG
jgi:hexokinase